MDPEGPELDKRPGHLSVRPGSSVCSKNEVAEGGTPSLSQGNFDGRDAEGLALPGGTGRLGVLGYVEVYRLTQDVGIG